MDMRALYWGSIALYKNLMSYAFLSGKFPILSSAKSLNAISSQLAFTFTSTPLVFLSAYEAFQYNTLPNSKDCGSVHFICRKSLRLYTSMYLQYSCSPAVHCHVRTVSVLTRCFTA